MTVLPTVRDDLALGALRQQRRHAHRRRVGRLTAATAIAVLALAGLALAAGVVHWNPGGTDVRVSHTAPPAAQRAALAVLRRPQTAADRSWAARQAIQVTSRFETLHGRQIGLSLGAVRADAVRVLGRAAGNTFVLIPRTSQRDLDRGRRDRDVLCVVGVAPRGGAGWSNCETTRQLLSEGDFGGYNRTEYALLPDRVGYVRAYTCATSVDFPVHENFFHYARVDPHGKGGVPSYQWLGHDRRPIATPHSWSKGPRPCH
jgi:hypothetical protein